MVLSLARARFGAEVLCGSVGLWDWFTPRSRRKGTVTLMSSVAKSIAAAWKEMV